MNTNFPLTHLQVGLAACRYEVKDGSLIITDLLGRILGSRALLEGEDPTTAARAMFLGEE